MSNEVYIRLVASRSLSIILPFSELVWELVAKVCNKKFLSSPFLLFWLTSHLFVSLFFFLPNGDWRQELINISFFFCSFLTWRNIRTIPSPSLTCQTSYTVTVSRRLCAPVKDTLQGQRRECIPETYWFSSFHTRLFLHERVYVPQAATLLYCSFLALVARGASRRQTTCTPSLLIS